ncbi:Thioredoxin domain-containing protein 17 [Taenia crassiceps]|uniref:Thioredoxin domain-containing protein 17 n=1 Tax=Taenia crassiceps TaxID=6207 RepID=A0ABR4QR92_9CEST
MALETVGEVLDNVHKYSGRRCFLYFIASPDVTGESWCPDCRIAQKPVEDAVKLLPQNSVFLTIHTGNRKEWKDPNNAFRLEPLLQVSKVPTLMEFGKQGYYS